MAESVARDICELRFPARHGWLHEWQGCSVHKIIWEEVILMRHQGIDSETLLEPRTVTDGPGGNTARDKSRKCLQANITKAIVKKGLRPPLPNPQKARQMETGRDTSGPG